MLTFKLPYLPKESMDRTTGAVREIERIYNEFLVVLTTPSDVLLVDAGPSDAATDPGTLLPGILLNMSERLSFLFFMLSDFAHPNKASHSFYLGLTTTDTDASYVKDRVDVTPTTLPDRAESILCWTLMAVAVNTANIEVQRGRPASSWRSRASRATAERRRAPRRRRACSRESRG